VLIKFQAEHILQGLWWTISICCSDSEIERETKLCGRYW